MATKKNSGRNPQSRKKTAGRPTSKKRPKKTDEKKMRINKEYHNLFIIFLGFFFLYCISTSSDAFIPEIVRMVLKGIFGGISFLVPFVMVIFGILGLVDGNERIDRIRKTKLYYVLFLFLVVYYGLINYAQIPTKSMLNASVISDTIKLSASRGGIGLLPSFITYYFTHAVGFVGAWLITLFATMIAILYAMKISVSDIVYAIKDPTNGGRSIFRKIKLLAKKNKDIDAVDDLTIIDKTSLLDKVKEKLGKKDEQDVSPEDDSEQTIKIVGFNKAEDDYLEILEGSDAMSDIDVLKNLQSQGIPLKDDNQIKSDVDKMSSLMEFEDFNPELLGDIDHNEPNTSTMGAINSTKNNVDDSHRNKLESNEDKYKNLSSNIQDIKPTHVNIPSRNATNSNNMGDIMMSDESEKYKDYKLPPLNLLKPHNTKSDKKSKQQVIANAKQLEKTLKDFGVDAVINQVTVGPTITRYEIQPKPGVKVSKIVNLTDDIALSLAARSIRIEAPIPGKSAIGIEVPNDTAQMVSVREIMDSEEFKKYPSKLAMGLGKDVAGRVMIGDIAKMPHLLIAGSTGSGKSVCVNTLITSILYKAKPNEVKLMLIDPKVVELANYNGIPHLLIPVVTDPKKAANALGWAVSEMNRRYKLFAQTQVKDIKSYNEKADVKLPRIVIIIDELADLMMVSANDVEDYICRLAQMARAAGMHLIVATQRPSVDVITGVIKSNIPSRIAFAVSSQIDSRTILDSSGAEKLIGKGDMLFSPLEADKPYRIQGAFISEEESERVIEYVKKEAGDNNDVMYQEKIEESIQNITTQKNDDTDEIFSEAIEFVVRNGQGSASMLQRKFKIGFNRAARLIDDMEERGIVGPSEGSKPRKVLISIEEFESLK